MLESIIYFLKAVFAVIFVLGIAINIHEFGHFIVARLLGMRVEAFSFFGIGPRIWGFKRGHTDYRISAIPLGAYVKLYGDEATSSLEGGSSVGEDVPKEELYELRPRWQKFLVMLGGPFMNIVLALFIPFSLGWTMGIPADPPPIVGEIKPGGAADKAGILKGDRIVAFDGVKEPSWSRIVEEAFTIAGRETDVTVERGGKTLNLKIKPDIRTIQGNKIGELGISPEDFIEQVVVGEVAAGMPAEKAGVKTGDRIAAVNGKTIKNVNDLKEAINKEGTSPISLSVERNGQNLSIPVKPVDSNNGLVIGIAFDKGRQKVGPLGAAAYAFDFNWKMLRMTGKVFSQIFSGEKNVRDGGIAGPIGIVKQISSTANAGEMSILGLFLVLLQMLTMISLNLGVFNLLPIPLLDGGQIMVLGIEGLMAGFGKTLSMAVKEKIQLAGFGMIITLMILVFYFDISGLFK
ncbi:MAG: RIP metalloprotease RseP [Pyrinomonadaceae bacterium]